MKLIALTMILIGTILVACSNGASTTNPMAELVNHYNQGVDYFAGGQYSNVLTPMSKAIALAPDNAEMYSIRGVSYYHLGQYENAIEDLDRSIQIISNNADVYSARGYSYKSLNQHQNAINDFDKAIQIDPNVSNVYAPRGYSYYQLGQYQNAINDFDKAIQLKPDTAYSYNWRAAAYRGLGESDNANADQAKACSLNTQMCQLISSQEVEPPGSEDSRAESTVNAENVKSIQKAPTYTPFPTYTPVPTPSPQVIFVEVTPTPEPTVRAVAESDGVKLINWTKSVSVDEYGYKEITGVIENTNDYGRGGIFVHFNAYDKGGYFLGRISMSHAVIPARSKYRFSASGVFDGVVSRTELVELDGGWRD